MAQIKQVVEVPMEEFERMKETQDKILRALENLRIVPPTEYLTPLEFMAETKMSRWKFDMLRSQGKLKAVQRGRKLYVQRNEVTRYFSGEME